MRDGASWRLMESADRRSAPTPEACDCFVSNQCRCLPPAAVAVRMLSGQSAAWWNSLVSMRLVVKNRTVHLVLQGRLTSAMRISKIANYHQDGENQE